MNKIVKWVKEHKNGVCLCTLGAAGYLMLNHKINKVRLESLADHNESLANHHESLKRINDTLHFINNDKDNIIELGTRVIKLEESK